jgi:7-cyano-7-deazaguanine synthase in queuosine biosynthesis
MPAERRVELPEPLPVEVALRGFAEVVAWSAESLDLAELAMAILLADRRVRRPRQDRRAIRVAVPLRRPALWRAEAERVEEILFFLTQDRFRLEPRQAKGKGVLPQVRSGSTAPPHVQRVVLFSGGLDSACAAADCARGGIPTVFLSHYTTGRSRLEELLASIASAYAAHPERIWHAGFYIRPCGPIVRELRENSRRSRSFLFVSLALAVAAGAGAGEVGVCENGPLALNLPLSAAMVPTHHAHGQFLADMEELAAALFGRRIRIINPYELATKGEMAAVFQPHPELALATTSCWYQQWSGKGVNRGKGHCGTCLPCLVRRASLAAAGIAIPRGHFDVDVLRAKRGSLPAHRLAEYRWLLDFAARIRACASWKTFLRSFPAAIEARPTYHPLAGDAWLRAIFKMMKRFSGEVESALGSRPS